jgi:hypothetical protein
MAKAKLKLRAGQIQQKRKLSPALSAFYVLLDCMMAVNGIGADTGGAADGANVNLQMQIPSRQCQPLRRQLMRVTRRCHLPTCWTTPCWREESHQQATKVPETPVRHFRPLADADGRPKWRVQMKTASEVQNKMIIMGHQISSCHVPVVRSFFIL